jgi:hypothetical protein
MEYSTNIYKHKGNTIDTNDGCMENKYTFIVNVGKSNGRLKLA